MGVVSLEEDELEALVEGKLYASEGDLRVVNERMSREDIRRTRKRTSLATVVPKPFQNPLTPSRAAMVLTTSSNPTLPSALLPIDCPLYVPACILDLMTSVGTRTRQAAVSASDAESM